MGSANCCTHKISIRQDSVTNDIQKSNSKELISLKIPARNSETVNEDVDCYSIIKPEKQNPLVKFDQKIDLDEEVDDECVYHFADVSKSTAVAPLEAQQEQQEEKEMPSLKLFSNTKIQSDNELGGSQNQFVQRKQISQHVSMEPWNQSHSSQNMSPLLFSNVNQSPINSSKIIHSKPISEDSNCSGKKGILKMKTVQLRSKSNGVSYDNSNSLCKSQKQVRFNIKEAKGKKLAKK